MESVISCYSC